MALLAYQTKLGKGFIEYRGDRVEQVYLPGTLRAQATRGQAPAEVRQLASWLEDWFKGKRSPEPAGLRRWMKEAPMPEFHRAV